MRQFFFNNESSIEQLKNILIEVNTSISFQLNPT